MTRQQGYGHGTVPGGGFIRGFNISFNLMLCEFCGNAEPRTHCPAKMRELACKWLHGDETVASD